MGSVIVVLQEVEIQCAKNQSAITSIRAAISCMQPAETQVHIVIAFIDVSWALPDTRASLHPGDSEELFIRDTLDSGGGLSNPALVRALVQQSSEALRFVQGLGANLTGTVR